jgi:hypothetical protein
VTPNVIHVMMSFWRIESFFAIQPSRESAGASELCVGYFPALLWRRSRDEREARDVGETMRYEGKDVREESTLFVRGDPKMVLRKRCATTDERVGLGEERDKVFAHDLWTKKEESRFSKRAD